MVRGLEEKFGDRMAFAIRNYQEGSSPAEIEQYGLDVHGMVMTDSDGISSPVADSSPCPMAACASPR